jgi:CMP-N-acetylneuraminic acid synthetase
VDVVWAENVLKEELLFAGDVRAYVMPPEFSEDIDTEFDFVIVEAILERHRV